MTSQEYAAYEVDGRMKDLAQQEKLELREDELRAEHFKYNDQHPELRQVLNDFISSVLLHRPERVFEFAAEYFSAFKQTDPEGETATAAEGQGSADSSGTAAE
eukprot:gnl/MRDRNA2_/MRDRNA2_27944_c0_seq1.p2 gnl/MRDRNA2_/MRDRNA2_27944_c0~~gnl/MRDRNA2_/MRDRNA2_27944_c0_seq1.p2  ORF type:complete len:103 (-),score=37.26 gnl/MRDRNA2_/MRDRNA2_27944_c0_seq1:93-401(-)